MKSLETVVTNMVNGILVKRLISQKGWTKQQAANYVTEFITSGTKVNFKEFMEAKA